MQYEGADRYKSRGQTKLGFSNVSCFFFSPYSASEVSYLHYICPYSRLHLSNKLASATHVTTLYVHLPSTAGLWALTVGTELYVALHGECGGHWRQKQSGATVETQHAYLQARQRSRELSGKKEKVISLWGCCKLPLNGIRQLITSQIANDLKG